ncbi:MAG: DNA mismatch repair protein MutL, partial [Clostridia bacterium]|nr:DNA mismatch repair protein MutL [Clostridia bacterium]
SIPIFLSNMNLDNFFQDVLGDLYQLKSLSTGELLRDKLAQKACKSAIKSGDQLDSSEVKILLDKLKENLGLKCPHGRPVAVKISRTEIDKWFKRIV